MATVPGGAATQPVFDAAGCSIRVFGERGIGIARGLREVMDGDGSLGISREADEQISNYL